MVIDCHCIIKKRESERLALCQLLIIGIYNSVMSILLLAQNYDDIVRKKLMYVKKLLRGEVLSNPAKTFCSDA